MARTARSVTWLIGHTPMVELSALAPEGGGRLSAKLEFANPTGSNKDRAVLAMIEHAERNGYLPAGGTVIECSGGDLGIAVAMVGRRRGYRVILTMPECMATNRCNLLRALGAEVMLTPTDQGIRGAMDRAEELAQADDRALCLQPFTNRANAQAHELGTAPEIWADTCGEVRAVVCPIGTGGTAAGTCTWFREHHPEVEVLGVEPAASPVVSGGEPGPHDIPGLGAGFVPEILDPSMLAEVLQVTDGEAVEGLRLLAAREGILAGPASGAVVSAAVRLAARPEMADRHLVAVLPDSGERYVEHPAYRDLENAP